MSASGSIQQDITTDTVSETQPNVRYDLGRQYYQKENFHYILPNDVEEADRMHKQHYMLRYAFKGNFEAPVHRALEEGIVVLDAGCGPGAWVLEMAESYPKSTFHGVDMAFVFPEKTNHLNCHFHLANLNDGLPFPDNHFDFVHQRLLLAGLTSDGWEKILTELIRVLKPGGWIELKEVNLVPSNAGPKLQLFSDVLVNKVLKAKGLRPSISEELKTQLEERDSLTNVKEIQLKIPVNHGGKLGELHWEDTNEVLSAMKPLFLKFLPDIFPDIKTVDKELHAAALECTEYKAFGTWYDVVAQKK